MITKTQDTEQELGLNVTNGDLAAIKKIKDVWKFKKVEDILRFALAVMVQSEDHAITIKSGGKDSVLSPAKELLETEEQTPKAE
jgi:hypothetical protein